MREIKFRAWVNVPNAKTMLQNIDLEELWMSGRAYEDYGTSRYEAEDISGIKWTFKDLIFMQYTGLKDRKGEEIFEGDILAIDDSRGCIEWGVGCFYFEDEIDGRTALEDTYVDRYAVILGNIYEHPELLEQVWSL